MDLGFNVSRELSLLFLVHLDVHKLTLIASLAEGVMLILRCGTKTKEPDAYLISATAHACRMY